MSFIVNWRRIGIIGAVLVCCWSEGIAGQTTYSSTDIEQNEEGLYLNLQSAFYGGLKDQLPFYLHVNRLGTVDQYSSGNWNNSIGLRYNTTFADEWKIESGVSLLGQTTDHITPIIPEGYVGINYYPFTLKAGRYEDPIGLTYHPLSVGSMMASHNAIPVPKISLFTPVYTGIPFTQGIAEFNALWSHGQLEESRFTESPYLHQKYLYLKFNIRTVEWHVGIVHQAMWGGENSLHGKLPQGIPDYFDVVFARSASQNAPVAEQTNVSGNSIAAYDTRLDIQFDESELRLGRLFYLEDGVSRRFRSPWDGMWSATWLPAKEVGLINRLHYEHINTKKQDRLRDYHPNGRARYYHHYIYKDGWSYNERLMAIPLVTQDPQTLSIDNNMIVAHHIGVSGAAQKEISYKAFLTYSRNYGFYTDTNYTRQFLYSPDEYPDYIPLSELRKDQWSGYVECMYAPRESNMSYQIGLTYDAGEFLQDQLGFMAGIRWNSQIYP